MGSEEREVLGVVDGIDGDSVARVLIGDDQEEWFFPLNMLPTGVEEGEGLRFTDQAGRYVVIGRVDIVRATPSIEDRLSRPLNTKKTAEVDLDDLRLARAQVVAEPAAASSPETPRPPARTRASRQRRW